MLLHTYFRNFGTLRIPWDYFLLSSYHGSSWQAAIPPLAGSSWQCHELWEQSGQAGTVLLESEHCSELVVSEVLYEKASWGSGNQIKSPLSLSQPFSSSWAGRRQQMLETVKLGLLAMCDGESLKWKCTGKGHAQHLPSKLGLIQGTGISLQSSRLLSPAHCGYSSMLKP